MAYSCEQFSINIIYVSFDVHYQSFLLRPMMASVTWSIVAVLAIINSVIGCDDTTYGLIPFCPGKSCLDIYLKNPSSHGVSQQYIVKNADHLRFVYCDMSLECGGEKGWMRIANINATGGDSCPI